MKPTDQLPPPLDVRRRDANRWSSRFNRAWRIATVVTFVLAIAVPIGTLVGFRLIISSSVPKGLWWVHSGMIRRNSYVFICLPPGVAAEGRQAGYLNRGICPASALPVMKRVVAMSGDSVKLTKHGLEVNGHVVPDSVLLRYDSHGRPIRRFVTYSTSARVSSGTVWLLGDWYRSWDSRYYGGVAAMRMIGIGSPVLVTPAGS